MIINVLGIFVWIESSEEYSVFSNRNDSKPWRFRMDYSMVGLDILLILD